MYTIVTGAAGFIGANIVKALNQRGVNDIIAVDDLTRADKFRNLADCDIADYMDKRELLDALERGAFDHAVDVVLHQGACSDTTATDGRYVMENNYAYSRAVLDYCTDEEIPLIYASSAAIYGAGTVFVEDRQYEQPLNVYGYSKFLFDQLVRRRRHDLTAQVVGLRYFNVYGPREQHKGRMASVAYHFYNQYCETGSVRLFEGSAGYGNGEQRRDFVSVEDVVKINMYFLEHPARSGIFNVGTGAAQTFNDVAVATVNAARATANQPALTLSDMQRQQIIRYVSFPRELEGKYQSYTQADVGNLREAGYREAFLPVEEGVGRYCAELAGPRPAQVSALTGA
jgi:ADP-L-glycero-D-manno-heptose 6-epimerase